MASFYIKGNFMLIAPPFWHFFVSWNIFCDNKCKTNKRRRLEMLCLVWCLDFNCNIQMVGQKWSLATWLRESILRGAFVPTPRSSWVEMLTTSLPSWPQYTQLLPGYCIMQNCRICRQYAPTSLRNVSNILLKPLTTIRRIKAVLKAKGGPTRY